MITTQQGEGILLRDPTINPPKVRKILESIGNEKIESITLIRTPLSKSTKFLVNVATLGQLKNKMKEADIDELFHLSMLINGKYQLEKNEVIMLAQDSNAIKENSQTLEVPVNKDITINQLLENTQKQMGNNYGSYDGRTNNCSVFLSNVLSSNGLSNPNTEEFVNQKTEELFSLFPSLSSKIIKFGTNVGAFVNRQIEGEGKAFDEEEYWQKVIKIFPALKPYKPHFIKGGCSEDMECQCGKGVISDVLGAFNPTLGIATRVLGYGEDEIYNFGLPKCKISF